MCIIILLRSCNLGNCSRSQEESWKKHARDGTPLDLTNISGEKLPGPRCS